MDRNARKQAMILVKNALRTIRRLEENTYDDDFETYSSQMPTFHLPSKTDC